MKNRCMKILAIIVLSVMILNYISVDVVFAEDGLGGTGNSPTTSNNKKGEDPGAKVGSAEAKKKEEDLIEKASKLSAGDVVGTAIDGIVGIGTTLLRVEVLLIGFAGQMLATVTANSAGTLENGTINTVTPDQILFNRLAITDINFFQMNKFGSGSNTKSLESGSPVKSIREGIANWYYVLRTIAVITLLCILVYIGIRMAMSTVAEEKAMYKKWLGNWVVSMALVFVLHYLILVVINVNNGFVDILYGIKQDTLTQDGWNNYVSGLMFKGLNPLSALGSWTAVFVYLGIVMLTFVFLIMYIKRMITIAFLILISPIITITYSIDKIKDGTSQALNTWFREFCEAVLIQPFHCIIYLVFISSAMSCIKTFGTLAAGIIVIFCMFFIFKAEKIIKDIFGIKTDAAGNGMQSAMAVMGTVSAAKSLMTKGAGMVGKTGTKVAKTPGTTANTAPVQANTKAVTQSNTAQQNMKNADAVQNVLSNVQGGNSKNRVTSNVYDSERLATIHSSEAAHASDYDYLMDDEGPQINSNETDKTIGAGNGISNENILKKSINTGVISPQIHTKDSINMQRAQTDTNDNQNTKAKVKDSNSHKAIKGAKTVVGEAMKIGKKAVGLTWKVNKKFASVGLASGITAAVMSGVATEDAGKMVAAGMAGYAAGNAAKDTVVELKEQGKNKFDEYMKKRKPSNVSEDTTNTGNESSKIASTSNVSADTERVRSTNSTSNSKPNSTSNVSKKKNTNQTKPTSKPLETQKKPISHPDNEQSSEKVKNDNGGNVVQTHDVGDNGELKEKMNSLYNSLMNNKDGE